MQTKTAPTSLDVVVYKLELVHHHVQKLTIGLDALETRLDRLAAKVKDLEAGLGRGTIVATTPWLNPREAATYGRSSHTAIREAIRSGALRSCTSAGITRTRTDWVDEWLEGRNGGE